MSLNLRSDFLDWVGELDHHEVPPDQMVQNGDLIAGQRGSSN
jgi:hypothetical protein